MASVAFFAWLALDLCATTPETSRLFDRYEDPESGAVSYILRPGIVAPNQQSIYFTHRSMTDDGRFLVLWISDFEFPDGTDRDPKPCKKTLALVDFEQDRVYPIGGNESIPFLDVARDQLYYPDSKRMVICRRDLLADPLRTIDVVSIPETLRAEGVTRLCTHLTLTADRKKAFLDCSAGRGRWIQGMLDLETGAWEKWGESDFIINHGQINPANDRMALCAHEYRWIDAQGVKHSITNWNGVYPRLQLVEPGRRTMVPPGFANYATHEHWTRDGRGFYWCNHDTGGETLYDLATGLRDVVCPTPGYHCTMSGDLKYLVYDHPIGPWYRGCRWMVRFWNRETCRFVTVYSKGGKVCEKAHMSRLHPDPHPQFACRDRYIVSTFNGADGHMNVMVTPVAGLLAMTRETGIRKAFADLPAAASPKAVSRRISERFPECSAAGCRPEARAPDVPRVWGRGAGWMAAGMALDLKLMPKDSRRREDVLNGFRKMAYARIHHQRADGLWGRPDDERGDWNEMMGAAMFAYAFVEGVRNGWLDPDVHGPAARKAWLALVDRLDDAKLEDVCIGTGEFRGQAPMLWMASVLIDAGL